jgi:hypothetical protein
MAMTGYQQIPKKLTLEVVAAPPPGLLPVEVSKNDYQEMQKRAYDDKKMDKRVKRLEALMDCVKDLGVIEQSMDSLSDRLGVDVSKAAPSHKKPAAKVAKAPTVTSRTAEWYKKESKSHAGRFYWVHKKTGQTVWKQPENWEQPESEPESMPAPKKDKLSLFDMLSDAEVSTDAGYTSVSDYDSDVVQRHRQRAAGGAFRADAPVFKPKSEAFRAEAPVFQPASTVAVSKDSLLSHRLFVVQRDGETVVKKGDITMRANAEITYPSSYYF